MGQNMYDVCFFEANRVFEFEYQRAEDIRSHQMFENTMFGNI